MRSAEKPALIWRHSLLRRGVAEAIALRRGHANAKPVKLEDDRQDQEFLHQAVRQVAREDRKTQRHGGQEHQEYPQCGGPLACSGPCHIERDDGHAIQSCTAAAAEIGSKMRSADRQVGRAFICPHRARRPLRRGELEARSVLPARRERCRVLSRPCGGAIVSGQVTRRLKWHRTQAQRAIPHRAPIKPIREAARPLRAKPLQGVRAS